MRRRFRFLCPFLVLGGLPGLAVACGDSETDAPPPTTEDGVQVNPLGLYVTDLRWTKQL